MNKNLYKNKYRNDTIRIPYWDYGSNGIYFVTICTKEKIHHFGEIFDNKMIFFDIGRIAYQCWIDIPKHFPFVKLDKFIVMPNHVHGVLVIDKIVNDMGMKNIVAQPVGTQNFASLQQQTPPFNKFGPQSQNLASIIRGFKIGVTKYARNNTHVHNVWQPRFYESIIKNDQSLYNVRNYIDKNVLNWSSDRNKFNSKKNHHKR